MRRRVAATMFAAALTAGLTLLAAPGAAASGKATVLTASLSGAREVPGPGDPDGRGRAVVKLAGGKACFVLRWSGIAAPTRATSTSAVRASPARLWCRSSSRGPMPPPCPTP